MLSLKCSISQTVKHNYRFNGDFKLRLYDNFATLLKLVKVQLWLTWKNTVQVFAMALLRGQAAMASS